MEPAVLLDAVPRTGRGPPRLVGVDGFSGSGKTTLATALAACDGVTVVSIEMFYRGWSGLADGVGRALEQLVEPLVRGGTPVVRPWDWDHDREGPPTRPDLPGDVVVLEGCGAGARPLRRHQALTVWVHADPAVREERLRARDDWPVHAPHRAAWERRERLLEERERTAAAADLVVSLDPDGAVHVIGPAAEGPDWVRSRP